MAINSTSMTDPGYELFTSLRYDPVLSGASFNTKVTGYASPYLLLPYHVDRLTTTARVFGWENAVATLRIQNIEEKIKSLCEESVDTYNEPDKRNGLRLRVLLSIEGRLRCEVYSTSKLSGDPLDALSFKPDSDSALPPSLIFMTVYVDSQPTRSSKFTSYKTTYRHHYDAARVRAGILDRSEPKEVLLWNDKGEITEASYRNVAFWRRGFWVTPRAESGALPGTVRRWMLKNNKIVEGTILKAKVEVGEWVLLSNGIDITILGRVEERSE